MGAAPCGSSAWSDVAQHAADVIRGLLEAGVREGVFPMAAAWIAVDGEPAATAVAGGAHMETVWDLASLTKPIAVVSVAMDGVEAGWLTLDERVTWPVGVDTTVRGLLAHRSGLPPWDDLAAVADADVPDWRPGEARVREAVARRIGALAGTQEGTAYSDLGFIVLGWHLERRLGRSLREMRGGWRPAEISPPTDIDGFAPAGREARRGRRLIGEVNDTNCWVLGGACGHAGLFGTADEVGRWALDLARSGRRVVDAFWDSGQRADSTWVLGWDTPSPGASSGGRRVSASAVGHLGFTGTSVWIDRDQGLVMVLLTNRVDIDMSPQPAIKRFRPRFHDAVRDVFGRGPDS